MPVSYAKLFELMKLKNIKKIDLRTKYELNPKTVDSLTKNKSVTVDTIMTLCKILSCQPGDIMEYVEDIVPLAQNEMDGDKSKMQKDAKMPSDGLKQ